MSMDTKFILPCIPPLKFTLGEDSKNRLIQNIEDPETTLNMLLCNECAHNLVLIEDPKTSNICKYTLTGFIQFLLENADIKTKYVIYIW